MAGFKDSVLIGLGTAAGLLLCEASARWMVPSRIAEDPILGHRARPGDDWDSRGFRNAAALEQADIVALGDSQTMGQNASLQEAWPQVYGRLAGKSVYQLAVGGYGPVQQAFLADQAIALRPKAVVLAVYLGNDLYEAYEMAYTKPHWAELRAPGFTASPVEGGQLFLPEHGRSWLRRRSRLYEYLGDSTRAARERAGWAPTAAQERARLERLALSRPDLAYDWKENPSVRTLLSPSYRLAAVDLDDPRVKEGWRIAQGRYRELAGKLKESGILLTVMIIPTKELAYLTLRKRSTDLPAELERYKVKEDALLAAMLAFFRKEGVDCFSARERLTEALGKGEAVYPQSMDGHPLPAGYRVIAEALHRHLTPRRAGA